MGASCSQIRVFLRGTCGHGCHNTLRPQLAVGRRVKNAEKRCGGVGTSRLQQRKAHIEVGVSELQQG